MSAESIPGLLHFSPIHKATNLTFLPTSTASTLFSFKVSQFLYEATGCKTRRFLSECRDRQAGRKKGVYGTLARQPTQMPALKADSSGTKAGAKRQVHAITHELTCILPHYWLADGRACRQDLRSAFALKGRFFSSPPRTKKRQTEQCSPTPLGGAVPQFCCPFPAFPSPNFPSYRKC